MEGSRSSERARCWFFPHVPVVYIPVLCVLSFYSLPFPSVSSRTPSLSLNSVGQASEKEEGRRHCKQPFYLHGRIAPDGPY